MLLSGRLQLGRAGVREALLRVPDLLLHEPLDIGLRLQRSGCVAKVLARFLDVPAELVRILLFAAVRYCRADLALLFTHATSSLVESTARSGTGGAASCPLFLPCSASTPAIAPYTTVTI